VLLKIGECHHLLEINTMRVANKQFIVIFALTSKRLQVPTVPYKSRALQRFPFIKTTMALCSSSASKCVPCSGLDDSAKLSVDEARTELESIKNPSSLWTLKESPNGVLSLSRKFTARNFQAAIDSINAVGAIAERENHHPDLHLTNYREVEIEIYTHKVNGITRNDFVLAEKINGDVAIEYSPKWLRENPDAVSTSKSKEESK